MLKEAVDLSKFWMTNEWIKKECQNCIHWEKTHNSNEIICDNWILMQADEWCDLKFILDETVLNMTKRIEKLIY